MRKLLPVLCFLAAGFLSAADEPVFTGEIPGSYAIYHDTRFQEDLYLGLCYTGEDNLVVRTWDTASREELVLLLPLVREGENLLYGDSLKVLKGDLKTGPGGQRLLPMILNWANAWNRLKSQFEGHSDFKATGEDEEYYFTFWVPVFRIRALGDGGDFSLITAGILKDSSDPRFFQFTGLPRASAADSYTLVPGTPVNPEIDGLKVPLDSNWKTQDNRVYRLTRKTPQDAVFLVETINIKDQGIDSPARLAMLMLIGSPDAIFLAEGSRVFEDQGTLNLFKRVYDGTTGKISIQQTQIISRGGEVYSLANLACFETLYRANREYFDRIIY